MSENRPSRRLLRSIVVIFAGLLAVFVLSLGTDAVMHAAGVFPAWGQPMPDSLFLLATVYRIVYSIIGSYIAARLAPHRPMQHAMILGLLGVLLSAVGAVTTWNRGPEFGPHWYPIALIVTALPCAWLGGKLREAQLRTRASG
jgi:surface polysaccharide O-acyltransferase-like enzyme